jgi:two-component system, chemotaxis family, response regulator Rcp1
MSANDWPSEILLIEDNPADVFLVQRSILKGDWNINLHLVENGREGLKFLLKQGEYSQSPTPDLVLLDLNLPIMDGRAFMAELVKNNVIKGTPVVVLTSSEYEADILHMYRLRCSAYFVKPIDLPNFHSLMTEIWSYWKVAQMLPANPDLQVEPKSSSRLPPRPRRVWITETEE